MAKQRIAVVTGGMGGLGETISIKMAGAGYRVVVTYSPSNTKYKSWLEEMKGKGYAFAAFPVDVVDYDDCARKCAQIQASGADAVVAGDLGCLLSIEGRLRRLGDRETKVLHVAEVLAGEAS